MDKIRDVRRWRAEDTTRLRVRSGEAGPHRGRRTAADE